MGRKNIMKYPLIITSILLILASCSTKNNITIVEKLLDKHNVWLGMKDTDLTSLYPGIQHDDFLFSDSHYETVKNKNIKYKVKYEFEGVFFKTLKNIHIGGDFLIDSLQKESILSLCEKILGSNYKTLHIKPEFRQNSYNISESYYWYNTPVHYLLEVYKSEDTIENKRNVFLFNLSISNKLTLEPRIYDEEKYFKKE